MVLLRVRGLARRPWIEGFDLDLSAGEAVVLRAPSGTGKTLVLRAIADLDPADGGEVLLEGAPREGIAPADWRRAVLYLHQEAVRLPGNVRENMDAVLGLAGSRGVVAEPPPGLDPDADVMRLSGGEMQRLALHRALALAPRVLLLDEATSALDKEHAAAVLRELERFRADGGALLWASHDAELAERLGGREQAL